MVNQTVCNQTRLDVSNNVNCSMTAPLPPPPPSVASTPERLIQTSPTATHSLTNGTALHAISQPYMGDSSNFGPFYHHHHHHHGQHHHISSYANPYDKFKSVHHARSPNTSPYDPYQSFYSPSTHHHHHHQIVRPNGYIDLVPR